ncbi:cyanophycinase [Nocardiopsis exhalans]|uniref:Cyanophycinase n=1 Tax=Nocardiopsis exhalans TaxID=163604 RepID=A0ABY5DCY8_9ACTN|nr:cyanophycinase [Nocardiopsis exhalans]USY20997.1 cyanophycinase [Nocardiopsis exhalans]
MTRTPLGGLTRTGAALVATALTAALSAPMAAHADSSAGPGPVVLVGGSLADERIYREIVELAGGSRARFGIVTASSVPESWDPDAGTDRCNNSRCNGEYYADLLLDHGAGSAEWIPVDLDHLDNAESAEVVEQVGSMDGFFFGGGDQYRYVTTLLRGPEHEDSAVLAAIRERLEQGALVAGTSAGAAIQQQGPMVTGGDSYQGVRDGSSPGYFDDPTVLGYLEEGGFGFFGHGLVDTHFAERGRQGRMMRLAADTGQDRVFGVDEDTALVVTGPGRMRVVGGGAVHVLDLRRASAGSVSGEWSVSGVRWSALTHGDTYDAVSWTASPGEGKAPLRPSGSSARKGKDVFSSYDAPRRNPGEMLRLARELADSGRSTGVDGLTYERSPRFVVELDKTDGFAAYRSSAEGVSFMDLRVGVFRH